MATDYVLAEAIQLIKEGKKDAARVMLERYLQRNPQNIQAWIWQAETFSADAEKIKVLESCLKSNPGNPQVLQALNFLKSRVAPASKPASPFTTSPFTESAAPSPFTKDAPPAQPKKPLPFTSEPSAPSSVSPFSSTSPFLPESHPLADDGQKKPLPAAPALEQPSEVEKQASPAKKSPRKHSKTTDMLIIAGVIAVFLLLLGGYVGWGFYLDAQINQAFAARQCADVEQRASFSALYPSSLFAFFFDGYDQIDQCNLKLSVDRAVEAKDWEAALSLAGQYITLYPQGIFTAEMGERSVTILSDWAKLYLENKNYSSGIQKSKQFIQTYPDHASNESRRDDILRAYLDWAKEYTEAKNYPSAEQTLTEAINYFESDAARAPAVKEELASVYVAWGDSQVAINNLDDAVKYYQQAAELLPDAVDADLLIARAYLQQALDIADKSDFNRALTKVTQVSDSAQKENIKTEAGKAGEAILKKYSESNGIQALEQINLAIPVVCEGKLPALPIFGLDATAVRAALFANVNLQLPNELAAKTPGQLHYVACIQETEKEISACPYEGGAVLYRLRYYWQVTLYDTKTAEALTVQEFKGGDPPACKPKELFTKGVKVKKSYGTKPTVEQVADWLQSLGILK